MRSSTPNYIGLLVLSLGVYNCKTTLQKQELQRMNSNTHETNP
jgi:hypothetical protein